jgi:hypothetical protein
MLGAAVTECPPTRLMWCMLSAVCAQGTGFVPGLPCCCQSELALEQGTRVPCGCGLPQSCCRACPVDCLHTSPAALCVAPWPFRLWCVASLDVTPPCDQLPTPNTPRSRRRPTRLSSRSWRGATATRCSSPHRLPQRCACSCCLAGRPGVMMSWQQHWRVSRGWRRCRWVRGVFL